MKVRYLLIVVSFLISGCSLSNTTQKVTNFAKCYIHQIPAPFWVCYQSSFQSVGKVRTSNPTMLKKEEAFSIGITELVNKLSAKTELFLRKINKNTPEIKNRINAIIKNFVIVDAIEGKSWYSKKNKMLYVEVKIDKDNFKRVLFNEFPNVDKNLLKTAFDEVF